MFGHNFYYGYFRKYIALFGTIFNDIHISRVDTTANNAVQTLKVPMMYGSQDKMLARLNSDPDLSRKVAAFSPAISFEHGAPIYDPTRKLQSTLQRCVTATDGTHTQYAPVPYNIPFTLYIYSKEEEDGLMVLEQILPYFTPSLTMSVNMGSPLNYELDVPLILEEPTWNDNSYGPFEDRRALVWTLKFTMKAEFGGPISVNPQNVIKQIYINLNDGYTDQLLDQIYEQPGVTANGEPTTLEANSIPVANITSSDTYGYVVEIIERPNKHS